MPNPPEGEPTNRAEQAQDTQAELREIAMQNGWRPRPIQDIPKARNSGLPEGTPLASAQSVTPGQKLRLEGLDDSPNSVRFKNQYGHFQREKIGRLYGNFSGHLRGEEFEKPTYNTELTRDKSAKLSAVAQLARQQYEADNDIYGESNDKANTREEYRRAAEAGESELPEDYIRDGFLPDTSLQGEINSARHDAAELYDLDPDMFSLLSDEVFIEMYKRYLNSDSRLRDRIFRMRNTIDEMTSLLAKFNVEGESNEAMRYSLSDLDLLQKVESNYGNEAITRWFPKAIRKLQESIAEAKREFSSSLSEAVAE